MNYDSFPGTSEYMRRVEGLELRMRSPKKLRLKKRPKKKAVKVEKLSETPAVPVVEDTTVVENTSTEDTSQLLARIPELRGSHIGYMLLSDEEIVEELKRARPQTLSVPAEKLLGPVAGAFNADTAAQIKSWESFYSEYFGLTKDFSCVRIPPKRPGFERLILVAANIGNTDILAACRKLFTVYGRHNGSTGEKDYAIWAKNSPSSGRRLNSRSVGDLISFDKIQLMNLSERLLFGLKYFLETKKHLDSRKGTACTAARKNYLWEVSWQGGLEIVCLEDYGDNGDRRGEREVVR